MHARLKKIATAGAGLLLLLVAASVTPAGVRVAERSLELSLVEPSGKETAIVLLGGRMRRLPVAIELQRRTQLPVIVSGAQSEDYVKALRQAGVREILVETRSVDTEQNAAFTSCRFLPAGFETVFLVTDALHMRRATAWFEHYGMHTTPAAVPAPPMSGVLPSLSTASEMQAVLHEWLGLAEFGIRSVARQKIPC